MDLKERPTSKFLSLCHFVFLKFRDDFLFSPTDDAPAVKFEMSKQIEENVKKQEEIAVEDDFIRDEPCSEDICPNEEKEFETNSFLSKNIHNDKIKNIDREEVALEDDFVLPSEDSSGTSRNMSSNLKTKSCQPLFVESSITTDEIKIIEQQKIALEDDIVRNKNSTSSKKSNSPNVMEAKVVLKENFSSVVNDMNLNNANALGRQMSSDNDHHEKVINASSSGVNADYPRPNKDSGPQLQNGIHEMNPADEDMINDPDNQLNTMSDIR